MRVTPARENSIAQNAPLKSSLQKVGALLCLCGILMASGLHTVVLQSYGWVQMYKAYSQTVSSATAIELTFSGEELCGICVLSQSSQQDLVDSLELSLNEQKPLVASTFHFTWDAPSADTSHSHGFSPPRTYQEITLAFDPPPPRTA